jgi:DsbC/DsbD-like thiol-disulfide interchange protein
VFVVLCAAGPAAQPRAATSSAARTVTRTTPHLAFTATLSPILVQPGARISIVVDVVPKKGIHVYAPGTKYRPVAIAIRPDGVLRVHDPVYPKPTSYVFTPLNEDVRVYDTPFRLAVDVTAGDTPARQAQVRSRSDFAIHATLEYQACDDTVCYLPVSVPVQWIVKVAR